MLEVGSVYRLRNDSRLWLAVSSFEIITIDKEEVTSIKKYNWYGINKPTAVHEVEFITLVKRWKTTSLFVDKIVNEKMEKKGGKWIDKNDIIKIYRNYLKQIIDKD